jgi:hypothetical protein
MIIWTKTLFVKHFFQIEQIATAKNTYHGRQGTPVWTFLDF